MSITPRILAFASSTRQESFNKKLIKISANFARQAGAEVTLIDLRDYVLPLFDADLMAGSGIPENGLRLKKLVSEHHGLLISLAEYNNSVTGVWKNAIDWISRPAPGEKTLDSFRGKVAAFTSAAPGKFGGIRALSHARDIFVELRVLVLPEQVAVPMAASAFDANGNLVDKVLEGAVMKMTKKLVDTIASLNSTVETAVVNPTH